jgi:hypothetical protein
MSVGSGRFSARRLFLYRSPEFPGFMGAARLCLMRLFHRFEEVDFCRQVKEKGGKFGIRL